MALATPPSPLSVTRLVLARELVVECAAGSFRGLRRATNQDQYLVAAVHPRVQILDASVPALVRARGTALLLAVADGMGGEGDGEVASAEAMIALSRYVERALAATLSRASPPSGAGPGAAPSLPGVRDGLHDAFARCHARILRKTWRGDRPGCRAVARPTPEAVDSPASGGRRPGCRAVARPGPEAVDSPASGGRRPGCRAVARRGAEAVDSPASGGRRLSPTMGTTLTAALVSWPRLYLAHAGDSRCYRVRAGRAEQLTRDHTLAAQLAEAGVRADPDSPYHHVLSNALGGGGHGEHRADVRRVELCRGDAVLVCSDGVSKYLGDDDIAAIVSASSAAQAVERLAAQALRRGGSDDITAVVAHFGAC